MSLNSPGQMTWRPPGATDCLLHLRRNAMEPWRPYTEFPEYMVPDRPSFSEGYLTFLALLKKNWQSIKFS